MKQLKLQFEKPEKTKYRVRHIPNCYYVQKLDNKRGWCDICGFTEELHAYATMEMLAGSGQLLEFHLTKQYNALWQPPRDTFKTQWYIMQPHGQEKFLVSDGNSTLFLCDRGPNLDKGGKAVTSTLQEAASFDTIAKALDYLKLHELAGVI